MFIQHAANYSKHQTLLYIGLPIDEKDHRRKVKENHKYTFSKKGVYFMISTPIIEVIEDL
jgi:hypothetical protein